jgi:hypothetical protein
MKRSLAILLTLLILSCPSFATETAQDIKTGSLNVYSKIGFLKIYLDDQFIGETPAELNNVKIGSHLVSATKNGDTVYEKIVDINEDEVTTILVSEQQKKEEPKKEEDNSGYKPGKNQSKSNDSFITQGLFSKIGYVSSYIYSYSNEIFASYYASSLLYGFGYSLELTPYAAVQLEIDKGSFANPDSSWTLTPMFISLRIGYPMAAGFDGIYYYSLGLGYYQTDLEYEGKNLSSVGFSLTSGMSVPFGDTGFVFLETGYGIAENSRTEFAMENLTFMIGFELNI